MKHPSQPLLSITAATVTGVALWLTRASFDVAGTTAQSFRVAMLPSPAELAGFVTLALVVAAGMAALVRSTRTFWKPATDALLPLFALLFLVLPYLPWVPDWIPALRVFAGPARMLIWFVVIGQVLWTFVPLLTQQRVPGGAPSGRSRGAVMFGILSVALSAPFVLNVRAVPASFTEVWSSVAGFPSASMGSIPKGALGVLFDQEYGAVAYAPVLLLGFVGLAGMLRDRANRVAGVVLTAAILVLLALAGSPDPWWNKSMMPGRPAFLLLPLLGVPIAWLYSRLEPHTTLKAGAQVLLLISLGITLALVRSTSVVPALQDGDGRSALLQWMSPTWQLPREVPTYVAGATAASSIRLTVWLAAFGIAAWTLTRVRSLSPGRSALAATATAAGLFIAAAGTNASVLPHEAKPFDVEQRVMFPLLETFDPIARPVALRYDPFARVSPEDLPPLFEVSAEPGQRTDRQPVRVVLNARFRLPAGRYVVDVKGSDSAGSVPDASLALQIGREGRPIESWPLVLSAGRRTEREFEVPLDAEFVGFRAARPVEEAIGELRVRPRHVIETRKRGPAETVLSAAAFAPVRIFFHDSFSYAEADGFWVKGRTTVRLTMLKLREDDAAVMLAVHSGARPNVVTLATPGWSQKLELVPGITQRVTVPSKVGERFIPLTISSADGFVPAEIDQSRDRRLLGAWVAFIPDDTARTSATP